MLKSLERNILDMSFSALSALKLHNFNLYERMPPAYRNMPEEHGLLRLYMHQSVAVRTDSVRAATVEMPGKDVLQSSRLVAGATAL